MPEDEGKGRGGNPPDIKGGKESQIPGEKEIVDPEHTESAGQLTKNDAPANPKTTISEVKRARPEAAKEGGSQPIPLEYKDVLE